MDWIADHWIIAALGFYFACNTVLVFLACWDTDRQLQCPVCADASPSMKRIRDTWEFFLFIGVFQMAALPLLITFLATKRTMAWHVIYPHLTRNPHPEGE